MTVPQTQRFVVIYRPQPKEPIEYIGPFVSQTIAERFVNEKLSPEAQVHIRPLLSRQDLDH